MQRSAKTTALRQQSLPRFDLFRRRRTSRSQYAAENASLTLTDIGFISLQLGHFFFLLSICTRPVENRARDKSHGDTTRHVTTRHVTSRHDTTRHETTRYDTARHNKASRNVTKRHVNTSRDDTIGHDTTSRHVMKRHEWLPYATKSRHGDTP